MSSEMTLADFAQTYVPNDAEVSLNENLLTLKKWNWDYLDCLFFQKLAQKFVQANRKAKIYIFTNHPHVFTLGRGNERGVENLKDLTENQEKLLAFPLHRIHRGGGITFHFPGQWIFYPIVSINQDYTLEKHTSWLLKSVRDVLDLDFGIDKVITANKLMGIWRDRTKLASIGVGISKFVTEHGLALNINHDQKMFDEVNKINPCGISPTIYTTADSLVENKENLLERFHNFYLKRNINL